MAMARRATRRNPGLLGWLREELSGEADRKALQRRFEAERARQATAPKQRVIPRTRAYAPATPEPKRPPRKYAVRVKDTHTAHTRPFVEVRKDDEFKDLADRAARGELTGDALAAFLNKFQVERKRK